MGLEVREGIRIGDVGQEREVCDHRLALCSTMTLGVTYNLTILPESRDATLYFGMLRRLMICEAM